MRSALLLQFVDVYDGGAGVSIGIFYIDDAGRLLFLLLYFFGCGIADEVSVSFLSVCFAKGRQQVSPVVGVSSGLLLLAAVVDSSSGRRGRRWRIQSSFLLFGGTANVLSTNRSVVVSWRGLLQHYQSFGVPRRGGWRRWPDFGGGLEVPVKKMVLRTSWCVCVIFLSSRVFSAKRQRCTVTFQFNTVFPFAKKSSSSATKLRSTKYTKSTLSYEDTI